MTQQLNEYLLRNKVISINTYICVFSNSDNNR